MKQQRPYPKLVVTRKAARSLKAGHPWVFEGEVIDAEPCANAFIDVIYSVGVIPEIFLNCLEK